jgi:hypothetical protein
MHSATVTAAVSNLASQERYAVSLKRIRVCNRYACRTEEELQYRAGAAHKKWLETYADAVMTEAEDEKIAPHFVQDIRYMANQSPAALYQGRLHSIMGGSGLSDAGKGRAILAARNTFKAWAREWGVEGLSVFSCLSYFMHALSTSTA